MTLPIAIKNHLELFPGVWSNLPWTCLVCDQNNDGTRVQCAKTTCPEDKGSRAHALDTLLDSIGQELSLMNEEEVEDPHHPIFELLSIRYLIKVLSPHTNAITEAS